MLTFNVVVVLASLCLAEAGTDLDNGLWMVGCARQAILTGVPDANIPSHNPMHIPKSLHINGTRGILSYKFDVDNLIWAGLPDLNIKATQLSLDKDSTAIFNFTIYWPKFVFSLDFDGKISVLFYKRETKGNFSVVINENYWSGTIAVQKPGNGHTTANFEVLQLLWTAGNVEASLEGLGSIGEIIADDVALATKVAFDTHFGKEQIQDFLKLRLNTIWASDYERVNKLIAWCRKQLY